MRFRRFFLALLLCVSLWATSPVFADHSTLRHDDFNPNPINLAGEATASFPTQLREALEHEFPLQSGRHIAPFIFSGGLHATAAGLTSAAFATEAFVPERVNQTVTAITYPDASTCWDIVSSDNNGISGWTRVGTSAYYFRCQAAQPTLPPNSAWLMGPVTTAGGAITARQDRRLPASFVKSGVFSITDSLYGATGDCTTDDQPAIQQALDIGMYLHGAVYIPGVEPGGCYRLNGTGLTVNFPAMQAPNLRIFGDGLTSFLFLTDSGSTEDILTINAESVTQQRLAVSLEDFAMAGERDTSRDGLVLRQAHRVNLRNVWATGVDRTGMFWEGTYLATMIGGGASLNVGTPGSHNTGVFQTGSGGGLRLQLGNAAAPSPLPGSNGNTFIGTSWETGTQLLLDGAGITIRDQSFFNTFLGGTSENNWTGLQLVTTSGPNTFIGMDIGLNAIDITDTGSGGRSTLINNGSAQGGSTLLGARLNVVSNDQSCFFSDTDAGARLCFERNASVGNAPTLYQTVATNTQYKAAGTSGTHLFYVNAGTDGGDNSGAQINVLSLSTFGGKGQVRIGPSGTAISRHLSQGFSLNLAAPVAVPACQDTPAQAFTNAALGDTCLASLNVNMQVDQILQCHVSAAGFVVFSVCQFTGAGLDPDGAGATYRADLWQH